MSETEQTEAPATEAVEYVGEEAPTDYDALLEQAGEALAEDGQDSPAEPVEDAPEAKDDAEPTDEDKAAEEPVEAKDERPEEEQAKDEKAPAWQFAQLRRQQKAMAQERDELRKLADELKPLKDDLSAMPDPRRDPLAFTDWAAGRAGLTPSQLYELATHRQLKQGEPDPVAEVAAMRAELDALKAEQAKRAEAKAEQAKQAQAAELLQADVGGVGQAAIAVGKYAAAWPKGRLEREAQAAVQWAYRNAPEMTYEAIAAGLEGLAKSEYIAMQQALGEATATPVEDRDTSNTRDGQGTPGAGASKPAGASAPRSTLTNNDAAQSGSAHRELTDEERYARAGAALAEST